MMSAVHRTEQLASCTGLIVRMYLIVLGALLVPGRRAENPPPAQHRGDDADLTELLGRAVERVAVENDQIGEIAREELAAPALVPREPGGRDAGGVEGLLHGHALISLPRRALVPRPEDPPAEPEK